MKKRYIIILLILVTIITGCGKSNNKKDTKPKLADDEVVLRDIKYKLDQDEEGYGIKYKIASNFRKTELINAINYFSENINDQAYFVIRIYQYPNKDIEYAIKDSVEKPESREQVTVGDKEYTKVGFTNYNGAHTNLYYYKHNKTVYTFVFTSGEDLSRLEDIFLKNISY